jgi:hypothetical protein
MASNPPQESYGLNAGVVTQWAGVTPDGTPTLPEGAFECNGATFSATQYPALEQVLSGTTLPNIPGSIIWTGGPLPGT